MRAQKYNTGTKTSNLGPTYVKLNPLRVKWSEQVMQGKHDMSSVVKCGNYVGPSIKWSRNGWSDNLCNTGTYKI